MKIRRKYPSFEIITSCRKKSGKRGKKYIKSYILFTNDYDDILELEKYIDVYEMINRTEEAKKCYTNLKRQLYNKKKNINNNQNNRK